MEDHHTIYRRGHPLAYDLRSRVMRYLQQGMAKTQIALKLCVSRSTVQRYQKLAHEQTHLVPTVRPRGGYRNEVALLDRQQILQLGEMLLRQPKLTIRELKQLAVEQSIINPDKVPSDITVWRANKKLNL